MELKRLITHFTYRIEPKPDGGFIARSSDPSLPPMEAPTRFELNQKIQANINSAMAAEFPALKLPLENKTLQFAFHIEHRPDGSFAMQSSDGEGAPMAGGLPAAIESHFAEKVAGVLSKHFMPGLDQLLDGQMGAGEVKVSVNQKMSWLNSPTAEAGQTGAMQATSDASVLDSRGDSSIRSEPTRGTWTIVRFVLTLLIVAAMMYVFLHRSR